MAYTGFSKLKQSIAARGGVRDPGAVAAAIGRAKYGKPAFQRAAAAGRSMRGMAPARSRSLRGRASGMAGAGQGGPEVHSGGVLTAPMPGSGPAVTHTRSRPGQGALPLTHTRASQPFGGGPRGGGYPP